ncbi:glycosyltransferase family 2 protein [Salinimicrobium soli]|uniref:glycosyltransferase family 2 protein n=1 Tax=Salinimicrobium soli TaxID=1254399 RepID=UPI003AAB303D
MNFQEFKRVFEKKKVIEFPNKTPEFPLLSVCIPTFNQVEFITDCLNGVLKQETDFPFEILLGDDGSSDGTREVCISYAERYPEKIRLFLHYRENNIKIESKATSIFNALYNIYSAKGRFIAYCDGDDIWADLSKVQKQVDYLSSHSETVLCYHKVAIIDEGKKNLPTPPYMDRWKKNFSSEELQCAREQPPISTWCFRNVIKEFPIEFFSVFNGDNFIVSLLGNYGNGKFLENIKPTLYRKHSGAMWSSENKIFQLRSKFNTYRTLSEYYERTYRNELSGHFHKRAQNYAKMILKLLFSQRQIFYFSRFFASNLKFFLSYSNHIQR